MFTAVEERSDRGNPVGVGLYRTMYCYLRRLVEPRFCRVCEHTETVLGSEGSEEDQNVCNNPKFICVGSNFRLP